MQKRGQFFLIAALLISGIAIGFSTLYNSAYIEQADTQVYDLSEELYAELQQTYDAGIVRGNTPEEVKENLKKLADYYQLQNPDSTFVIFYGDGSKAGVEGVQRLDTSGNELVYEETGTPAGTTQRTASAESSTGTSTRGAQSETAGSKNEQSPSNKAGQTPGTGKAQKVKVRVKFKERAAGSAPSQPGAAAKPASSERVLESPPFELKPGQSFYFVIRKKVKNEQVVVYRQ